MKIRKKIIVRLFEWSQRFYTLYFKRKKIPWDTNRATLLTYQKDSFGRELGLFLQANNFELIPKVERHDAYHVLTGYGTKVEDEIALQYVCFGNGKRSIYLFGVILLGTLLLPDYLSYYLKSYRLGKQANSFYDWDFNAVLTLPLSALRQVVFPKEYHTKLKFIN